MPIQKTVEFKDLTYKIATHRLQSNKKWMAWVYLNEQMVFGSEEKFNTEKEAIKKVEKAFLEWASDAYTS